MSVPTENLTAVEKIKLYIEIAKCDLPLESLHYGKKALELSTQEKNPVLMAEALEEISLSHRKLGNNVYAVNASKKGMDIYTKLGLHKRRAALLLQLGTHFTSDKDFSNGLQYIREGLSTYKLQKDTFNSILAYINLGETYRLMGNPDSAATCFHSSLRLNHKRNDPLIRAYALGNLGLVHASTNSKSLAMEELKEAVSILQDLGDLPALTVYQSEIGKLLFQSGNRGKGLMLLQESLNIAHKEQLKEQIHNVSKSLAQNYEEIGNYREALKYRKQYESYHDSLANLEKTREMERMANKIELEKKEAEIRILEESNISKKIILTLVSIASCILLLVTFLLFRTSTKKREANILLQEQKREIEEREKEKAILLTELNHRIKNNLQMVSSLFNMQLYQFKDHPAAEVIRAGKFRMEALTLIHQKLYHEAANTEVELKEYIEELVRNLLAGFGKNLQLKLELDAVLMGVNQAIPLGLIINELVTNSLKHAFKSIQVPWLSVQLRKQGSFLLLQICDNGPGLPEIWVPNQSQSLGLKLVKSLSKQLKGELHYSTTAGCEWTLLLPLKQLQTTNYEQ